MNRRKRRFFCVRKKEVSYMEKDFHPEGAIGFAEARGQISPDSQGGEITRQDETEDHPDGLTDSGEGNTKFSFSESGSGYQSSAVLGFTEFDSG